jgi:predicted Zn-dependent peptidase
MGAYINAFTSKEQTCFYVRALTAHLEKCLSLLAEVALEPAFRSVDINKERKVVIEEIKSFDDDPEEHILDLGETLIFGNHPLATPIAGTVESLESLSSDDLRAFHTTHYGAHNILVAVAGNVSHGVIHELCERTMGKRNESSKTSQRQPPQERAVGELVLSKPYQQSHLLLVRQCGGVLSSDRHAISLLNTILGDGMSSRLHQRIREKSGLSYSMYSSLQLLSDSGILSVYAGTDKKNLARTERLIAKEMRALSSGAIAKNEIARAKEQVKSGLIMSLESMSSRMHSIAKAELEEHVLDDTDALISAVDGVSAEEIARVASEYCNPDTYSRVRLEAQ